MARKTKQIQPKKAVYVFWEGESEKAYTEFLRKFFVSHCSISVHREKGLFDHANAYFRGNNHFKDDLDELDEIWFFFDVEADMQNKWEESMKYLKDIRTARKKNPIQIRLLMTRCCIEYWFLLHYERCAPSLVLPGDKEKMLERVRSFVPQYQKGNIKSTAEIAKHFDEAIKNGEWTLALLENQGIPTDPQKRDRWLFEGDYTFTTVHEAIVFLKNLPKL